MMPQADSAMMLSTHWQAAANSIPANSTPYAKAAVFITATSSAAEEPAPFRMGISDLIWTLAPHVIRSGNHSFSKKNAPRT